MSEEEEYLEYEKTSSAAHLAVTNGLKWGREDGVEIEVIMWAMMYLRDHPGSTIPEAIDFGLEEWLK